jgi:hypothetical protein
MSTELIKSIEKIESFYRQYASNESIWFLPSVVDCLVEHLREKFASDPEIISSLRVVGKLDPGVFGRPGIRVNSSIVAYLIELYYRKVKINLNRELISAIKRVL